MVEAIFYNVLTGTYPRNLMKHIRQLQKSLRIPMYGPTGSTHV